MYLSIYLFIYVSIYLFIYYKAKMIVYFSNLSEKVEYIGSTSIFWGEVRRGQETNLGGG